MSSSAIAVDQAFVVAGTPEELAGPATRPVAKLERISSVDTLRGLALLGILAMNITSFGLPEWAYAIPLSTPLPVFSGPHWKANTIVWFLRWVLAEGKMRALFSMLFGAGVILLTSRAEARGAGERTADIFTRRNMWLTLFGVLHCYLIWNGDILYFYGLMGLLFLFPMRKLQAKTLMGWGVGVLVLNGVVMLGVNVGASYSARTKWQEADKAYRAGKVLTAEQQEAIRGWKETQEKFRPPQEKIDKDMKEMHRGYVAAQMNSAKDAFMMETSFLYLGFGDILGMMMVGMALYRNGFLTLKLSAKTYAWTAVIGLGVAWPLIFAGCWMTWKSHFDMFVAGWWLFMPYDIGRIGGAVGNAALVLLMLKTGVLRWPLARLANVGQMALSNYLFTSSFCKFLFVWGPLHWYGRLEYYQLYFVAAGVWTINLVWSTIWLRYFQFGPAEWVWRSLTYWKKQPMRIVAKAGLPLDGSVVAG